MGWEAVGAESLRFNFDSADVFGGNDLASADMTVRSRRISSRRSLFERTQSFMRTMRHTIAVLTAIAASGSVAACGTTGPSAGTVTSAKKAVPTSSASTATPTPNIILEPGQRDPRSGTDPKIYATKPKVVLDTGGELSLSVEQQRDAVAFIDDLMHRSHLDFSKLPSKRTPSLWKNDFNAPIRASLEAAAKEGGGFGDVWGPEWSNHMRATGMPEYSITTREDTVTDYGELVTSFSVHTNREFDIYAGAPDHTEDVKARAITTLSLGVLRGSGNSTGWQVGAWQYEGGSSRWEKRAADGTWVLWE